ncbi:MAG: thioredoxin domain-containing protein [Flavobacteriaceae bacterium]|nr:thioredoxin domain-containing protein [Flavobacteriaceae bacterium]
MKESLVNLIQILLKKNKIPFDREELVFQIQSHPSYPSLHAITGVLEHFNIENVALDIPITKEVLNQLPDCFIAQINNNKGQNLVVVERKGQGYLIFDSEKRKTENSVVEFLEKFTGILVAVEQPELVKKVSPTFLFREALGLVALTMLASLIVYFSSISWYTISYLLLSTAGVLASVAIIKQELGLQSFIGNAFCSGNNEKKDCDAVLTSKGAHVFKDYKLSDFSLLYFTGLTLLTFFQISNPVISFSISLLAIPITLYSIYYQYVVLKKWCLLCLSIVVILWLQALVLLLTNTFIENFITKDFIVFGLVGTSTWLIWNYLKPLFVTIQKQKEEKIESVKFKRNYTLFESLLQKKHLINTEIIDSKEIVFGNSKSNLEIIIVTNPFCSFCRTVHQQVEDILHKYREKVKIKIRFNVFELDESSDVVTITTKLLQLYNEEGNEMCLQAMGEVYSESLSTTKWLDKWKRFTHKESYINELKKQGKWCQENGINFTPEVLINGKSLPKEYKPTDVIFFIEDLEENCSTVRAIA